MPQIIQMMLIMMMMMTMMFNVRNEILRLIQQLGADNRGQHWQLCHQLECTPPAHE